VKHLESAMSYPMTAREVDDLVSLCRNWCESVAACKQQADEGRLPAADSEQMKKHIRYLEIRMQALQGRARVTRTPRTKNVISLATCMKWKAAR
jgi:hypothetical protein